MHPFFQLWTKSSEKSNYHFSQV